VVDVDQANKFADEFRQEMLEMSRTDKDRNKGYWSRLRGIPSWFKKMQKKQRKAK